MPIDNSSRFPKPLAADLLELSEGMAIVIDGDTAPKAITAGQYLFIKNHSTLATGGYHATAAIASGASITSSNVAADTDGIVNGAVSALNGKLATISSGSLHDIKSSGAYFLTNAVSDKPTSTGGSYIVGSNGNVVCGIFTQNSTGNTYAVRYDGSTWTYEQLALNGALASKVNTSDIANNLTTTASGKVLDARQGKMINDKVTNLFVIEQQVLTFSSGVATVSAKSGYLLVNVIAQNRTEASYSPSGISLQTGGSYKVLNCDEGLSASLQCRLFWVKS